LVRGVGGPLFFMILFKASIPGRVPVKKNTAKVFKWGAVYSKAWKEWEKQALKVLKELSIEEPIDKYCQAKFTFYFKNHQWEPDVSNVCEGPQDVLQKAGILTDDKNIARLSAEKHFNDDNPRVEIEISELSCELYAI